MKNDLKLEKDLEEKVKRGFPLIDCIRNNSTIYENIKSFLNLQKKGKVSFNEFFAREKPVVHSLPEEISQFRNQKKLEKNWAQLFASPQTMEKKYTELFRAKRNICSLFCLGDDDLFSIYVASKSPTIKIIAADIDPRIVNYINKIAKKKGLNIEAICYDVRKPLPNELIGKFDAFTTDSSHCLGGIVAFTNRGLASLKLNADATGQFIIQTINEEPVMNSQKRKMIDNYLRENKLFTFSEKKTATYEIPLKPIIDLKKTLINLANSKKTLSEKTIKNALIRIGFSEFMPNVTLSPEKIVTVHRQKNTKPPINEPINEDFFQKYGPLYYYEYGESK